MTENKNKEIIRLLFDEVFNHRNLTLLDKLISPTYTNHNASIQVKGVEGLRKAFEAQFKAFPDLRTTLEDMIAEGDKVVVRCIDHFTRQPDGAHVSIPWIEIIRLENGKLVEAWVEMDTKLLSDELMKAIGSE